ncbi:hypothetical protein [Microlunatus sp. Gsoil 973]|uniref:hypothetical protein n=1 Tax=Microlunatus sp. Gsoil 973 TaxID=2672569 RepID=UPI0012B4750A|nr:hypothetical protein [Microlunatus sp. Gsoil 973]QGN34484.1 hypothetical protein GJV80_18545 [Microlunatus sp. Gsoil 973]
MITALHSRPSPPRLVQLGYDDGWLLLPPTFLNLRIPVVIVDHAYTDDPIRFGLEPFGTRDPKEALPQTDLRITYYGNVIALRTRSTAEVLTTTVVRRRSPESVLGRHGAAALIIGNTYNLESTWAALWTMAIGKAKITTAEEDCEHTRTAR